MSRLEKLLLVAVCVGILDVAIRLVGAGLSVESPRSIELISQAAAQSPIIGVSLLPRYVITTNQNGNIIYVWEDQGKGYEAKLYFAPQR